MASRGGEIKKTPLEAFANIRSNGLKAFSLEPGDELVSATLAKDEDDYIIITKLGQALMANVGLLRSASRGSGGVRGIKLQGRDEAIAMDLVLADHHLIVMSVNGVGKLTRLDSHHAQKRGGTGVLWFKVTEKVGAVGGSHGREPGPRTDGHIRTGHGVPHHVEGDPRAEPESPRE